MRMLRIALSLAFGLALLAGTQAWAADGTGAGDEYGTGGTGSTSDYGAGSSTGSAGQEMGKSIGQQATFASKMALYDQQASAMADLAIERSKDPKVLQYARDVKSAHERNLTALRSWAGQKKVEIASVDIMVPSQGTGGTGMTEQEKKAFDEKASKYGEQFRQDAKEAQDEVIKLSQASSDQFDQQFLSGIDKLHQEQSDAAKSAKSQYSSDAAFVGLMASTESAVSQLRDSSKSLEDQLNQ